MLIDTERFAEKISKATPTVVLDTASGVIRQSNSVYIPTMIEYSDTDGIFCIVSAPGATGKSALCDFLAKRTDGIVWNLANASIGTSFILGTLARSHGNKSLANVIANISNGKYTLILDAVDEAEIISGWNNIQIMLDEIIDLFGSSVKNQVIIVARNDTAEYISTYFQLKNVGYSRAWVKYFNETQKKDFCREYLKSCKKTGREAGYLDAIDDVIKQVNNIYNNATRNANVNSSLEFTGYAPVLQAITKFVAEYENPAKASSDFKNGTTIKCIKTILHDILKREQKKFYDAFKLKLNGANLSSDINVYTPEEQLRYILEKYKKHCNPSIVPPALLPLEFASEYVKTINEFFPEHPFFSDGNFSGVAFRDYVLVEGLLNTNVMKYEDSFPSLLEGSNRNFSPLLWEFYKDTGLPIKREAVGYLMESILSGEDKGSSVSFLLFDSLKEGRVKLEIIRSYEGKDDIRTETYLVEDNENPIVLSSKLCHLNCNVDTDIRIDSRYETVCLGDTYLSCRSLDIDTNKIDVLPSEGQKSTLIAIKFNFNATINISGTDLEVYWEGGNIYPWSTFFCDDYALTDNSVSKKKLVKIYPGNLKTI